MAAYALWDKRLVPCCDGHRAIMRAKGKTIQWLTRVIPWLLARKLIEKSSSNSFLAKQHKDNGHGVRHVAEQRRD
jgi:hypothetical protein